jgi:hypothetical protein
LEEIGLVEKITSQKVPRVPFNLKLRGEECEEIERNSGNRIFGRYEN